MLVQALKEKKWKTNNQSTGLHDECRNVKYDTRNSKCGGGSKKKCRMIISLKHVDIGRYI